MKKDNLFRSPVIASSGLLGIIGEGYKYHRIFKILLPILFSFKWITFQMKTITACKKIGNMELSKEDGITPVGFRPNCIYANFWKGYGVNNVSFSNPGIKVILDKGVLQKIEGELHLSIMFISQDLKRRIDEAKIIVSVLKTELKKFKATRIFLHWNVSCPNTGHNPQESFLNSFRQEHEILKKLGLPIILKVGWSFPINVILELQKSEMIFGVDAINTIPFDDLPAFTKKKYFKRDINNEFISPLDKYQDKFLVKGRGGVSGNPIRPYALRWIRMARKAGFVLPIIGGGGILWPWHVFQFKKAGATAISPGSVSFLRPFNLLFITLTALILFKKH
jgi:dihydroorotate dehydrogenase